MVVWNAVNRPRASFHVDIINPIGEEFSESDGPVVVVFLPVVGGIQHWKVDLKRLNWFSSLISENLPLHCQNREIEAKEEFQG